MDTINIINNFDQNILMENILILNQKKLLDMMISLFEQIKLDEGLSQVQIIEHINAQKFINWELFVNLINLDTLFDSGRFNTKSLFYLVDKKSIGLLEFLLSLETGQIHWENQIFYRKSNIFHRIFYLLNDQDKLISHILDSNISVIKNLLTQQDSSNKTPIDYILTRCSETVILEYLRNQFINLDWVDNLLSTNLIHITTSRNFPDLLSYLIEKQVRLENLDKYGLRPIHIACSNNNLQIVKLLVENNVDLNCMDNFLKTPIDYAITHGNFELIKYLISSGALLNLIYEDADTFENVLDNQDSLTIDYFLSNNIIDFEQTNFPWIISKLLFKQNFKQAFKYSTIKIGILIKQSIDDASKYYIDGHYMGDEYYT